MDLGDELQSHLEMISNFQLLLSADEQNVSILSDAYLSRMLHFQLSSFRRIWATPLDSPPVYSPVFVLRRWQSASGKKEALELGGRRVIQHQDRMAVQRSCQTDGALDSTRAGSVEIKLELTGLLVFGS